MQWSREWEPWGRVQHNKHAGGGRAGQASGASEERRKEGRREDRRKKGKLEPAGGGEGRRDVRSEEVGEGGARQGRRSARKEEESEEGG